MDIYELLAEVLYLKLIIFNYFPLENVFFFPFFICFSPLILYSDNQ